jgi:hypothetical protein
MRTTPGARVTNRYVTGVRSDVHVSGRSPTTSHRRPIPKSWRQKDTSILRVRKTSRESPVPHSVLFGCARSRRLRRAVRPIDSQYSGCHSECA